MKTTPLDPEKLRAVFALSSESPSGIVWMRCTQRRIPAGTPAGRINQEGYYNVQLLGKTYLAHRIVWALSGKSDPGSLQVDHIDGNRKNNDPSNLRLVTNRVNNQNKSNHSGLGVGVKAMGNKFQSRIRVKGKLTHLGTFHTAEEASLAYQQAACAHALPIPRSENN